MALGGTFRGSLTTQASSLFRTGTCPACRRVLLVNTPSAAAIDAFSTSIIGPFASRPTWIPRSSIALDDGVTKTSVNFFNMHLVHMTCHHCAFRWKVFATVLPVARSAVSPPPALRNPGPPDPVRPSLAKLLSDLALPPAPTETGKALSVNAGSMQVISYTEQQNSPETLLTEEIRRFDNRKSTTSSVETLHITNTVERRLVVELDRRQWVGGGAEASVLGLVKLKGTIQSHLSHAYKIEQSQLHSYDQTTAINVPAGACVDVHLYWKLSWTIGNVRIGLPRLPQFDVPYAVSRSLIFDRSSIDCG